MIFSDWKQGLQSNLDSENKTLSRRVERSVLGNFQECGRQEIREENK